MSRWRDRLRFLWEEEIAPPGEAPRERREEPAGVPGPLRRATRFALISAVGTTLMAQVIGVRLIAPVDASPSYVAQCIQHNCKSLRGRARVRCIFACLESRRGFAASNGSRKPQSEGKAPAAWWYPWYADPANSESSQ